VESQNRVKKLFSDIKFDNKIYNGRNDNTYAIHGSVIYTKKIIFFHIVKTLRFSVIVSKHDIRCYTVKIKGFKEFQSTDRQHWRANCAKIENDFLNLFEANRVSIESTICK